MIQIFRTKLNAMCGCGVVVKVHLITPVLNTGAVVGRIFIGGSLVCGNICMLAVGICVGIKPIFIESNCRIAE